MRKLLICPYCQLKNQREVLGEIDADGFFVVERYRNRQGSGRTRIISTKYIVQCGVCKELVYYKRIKNEQKR